MRIHKGTGVALSCVVLAAVCGAGEAAAQSRRPAQGAHKPPGHTAETQSAPAAPAEPAAAPAEAKPSPVLSVEPAAAESATAVQAAPAAKPTAEPAAAGEPAPDADKDQAELASLHQDLAQVMDDLVQARARVAVLGKALFKTRVRLKIDDRAQKEQSAVRLLVWLDGAPIWSGDGTGLRDPDRVMFDGFAAPGPHVLTVEVEQRARRDENYRYTLHESYRFSVIREKRTDLRLLLDDDSDMADDFASDAEGEYDVRTRLQARAVGLNEE